MKNFLAALLLLPLMPALALAQNAAPDTAAAKALWEGNNTQCRNCHGKDGRGRFRARLAGRGLSAAEFQQAVRKPWGIMPAFVDTQISDADLAGLAAYFAGLPKEIRRPATGAIPRRCRRSGRPESFSRCGLRPMPRPHLRHAARHPWAG